MRRFPVIVLLASALGFFGFGLWFLADPVGALALLGGGIEGDTIPVELRAFYGGMELGLAAFLVRCAMRPDWRRPGLWLVLLANAGTGLARLAALLAGGPMIPFFAGALVWEFGFAAAAALALRSPDARNG